MKKDSDRQLNKLKTIIFAVVFAIVCGIGVSVVAFLTGTHKLDIDTGAVTNEHVIKIYIKGEINSPGLYELNSGGRVEDAISIAGGLTENADDENLQLAATLRDGQTINVPAKSTNENSSSMPLEGIQYEKSKGKININTADEDALDKLPGVGPSTAKKIIDYRNKNGCFETIEDLMCVSGIGEKKFKELYDFICVR